MLREAPDATAGPFRRRRDGYCRGFAATAKGSYEEADGHQMREIHLLMKVVNPLRSDNLIGIAMPRSTPGSGRDPERETPRLIGAQAFAISGCGGSQHPILAIG